MHVTISSSDYADLIYDKALLDTLLRVIRSKSISESDKLKIIFNLVSDEDTGELTF